MLSATRVATDNGSHFLVGKVISFEATGTRLDLEKRYEFLDAGELSIDSSLQVCRNVSIGVLQNPADCVLNRPVIAPLENDRRTVFQFSKLRDLAVARVVPVEEGDKPCAFYLFIRVMELTDILSQNVPLEDVQYLAGHSNPSGHTDL